MSTKSLPPVEGSKKVKLDNFGMTNLLLGYLQRALGKTKRKKRKKEKKKQRREGPCKIFLR